MADFIPKVPPIFQTSLATPCPSTATTTDIANELMMDGIALTGLVGVSIDIGQPNPEYAIAILSGKTLTFITRGIRPLLPRTSDPALVRDHRRGAVVKITDFMSIGLMRDLLNGNTPFENRLAYLTHLTFTPGSFEIPDVKYVDDENAATIAFLIAYIQNIALSVAGGSSGSMPKSFGTFSINNWIVPKTGYFGSVDADFNYKTAANGGLFALQTNVTNQQIRNYVTDWASATSVVSFALLGGDLYVLLTDGTNYGLYLYDATNLSLGGTLCTGITFGTQAGVVMSSDGFDLFFNFTAGNSANDYSISKYTRASSVLTFVSTTNLGAISGVAQLFLVDTSGFYYGFNSSNQVKQYSTLGVLQFTTDAYQINPFVLNWNNTFYGISTSADIYNKLELTGTSSFFIGTIIGDTANQSLTRGQTVGIAPFGGGFALAGRKVATIGLPSAPDSGAPTRQVWLGDDRLFLLYVDSGTGDLLGVVGTVNRSTMTISWGTPHTYSSALQGLGDFAVCKLDTDKVAVLFVETGAPTDVIIDVSTVAGSVITPSGNQAFVTMAGTVVYMFAENLSTDKAVIYAEDGTGDFLTAFTVTGTTLGTVGSAVATADKVYYIANIGTDKFAVNSSMSTRVGSVSGVVITLGALTTLPMGAGGGSTYEYDIVSLGTDAYAVTSHQGSTASWAYAVTVSGVTPTVSTQFDLGATANVAGLVMMDATHVIVYGHFAGGLRYQVLTISGAAITNSFFTDNSSNVAAVLNHNYLRLGTYFIIFDETDDVNTTVDNSLFIQGMSLGFLGIAESTTPRGQVESTLIKGEDVNQVNLVAGQHYRADGNGGVTQDPAGPMVGKNSTTIIL